jgi:cytoskeletal protein RodZ
MRARIDITEVEVRTKIRAKYLRAMENEEWDMLPGPVYVKSFLRTYSDFLGLDSRMLIDDYRRRYERPSDETPRPIATLGRERDRGPRRPRLPSWVVVGLVLLAIVVVLDIVGNATNNNPTPPSDGASATTPHKHHKQHRDGARTTTPTTTTTTPTAVTLHIVPTTATGVYICMANQAGTLLIPGKIYTLGEAVPVETAPKLLLTLGNSEATLHASFGAITVAPSSQPTNLLIGPTSYRPLAVAKAPNCG